MYTASQYGLGTWKGSLITDGDWCPGKRGISSLYLFSSLFLTGHAFLLVVGSFSLIIKADARCVFDRPPAGCFS